MLILSFVFYAWGSGRLLFWLAAVILINFWIAKEIAKDDYRRSRVVLWIGIFFNLAVLFNFKYLHFFYVELLRLIPALSTWLPVAGRTDSLLGVSFFTFVAISYLVEVFQRKQTPLTSLIDFGMVMALFPKLLSGPIVRYSEIRTDHLRQTVDADLLFEGIWRFSIGLGKKAIIANNLGTVADRIFDLPGGELTTPISWLGIICYTFQIYFDFSGYTDMAIGLG
ncbi:MAG: MBOAT family protein, partial [Candidatus Moranbacteria bacterium]|nr:MBOAT family protein [Candidatus Moranbacteria bacterium]